MKHFAERELRHIIDRAEAGHITAETAVNLAVAQGYLAIGTALSKEGYIPGVPLTVTDGQRRLGWRPRLTNERGGIVPIVRAGTVASTAIWAAFGGDVNEVFQRNRVGRPILPVDRVYDLGSQGWLYEPRARTYQLQAHPDLVRAGWARPADGSIGAVDFVANDGSFMVEIPGEPGHLGSTLQHETVGTIPVRIGDVQARLGSVATALFDYEPLPR